MLILHYVFSGVFRSILTILSLLRHLYASAICEPYVDSYHGHLDLYVCPRKWRLQATSLKLNHITYRKKRKIISVFLKFIFLFHFSREYIIYFFLQFFVLYFLMNIVTQSPVCSCCNKFSSTTEIFFFLLFFPSTSLPSLLR